MASTENRLSLGRLYTLIILFIVLFIILSVRLYNLQITNYPDFATEAVNNMYRRVEIPAPRGIMFDRYSEPLVYNTSHFDVVIYPYVIRGDSAVWNRLSLILEKSVPELKKNYDRNYINRYTATRIESNIDFKMLSHIQEFRSVLPGVDVVSRPARKIRQGIISGHLFGYTGEINRDNINRYSQQNYKPGDIIGVKGLEKQYEQALRGKAGLRYIKVNALGQDFGEDFSKTSQPIAGNDLYLTIDAELQEYCESLYDGLSGGLIMMDYTNGEILAFVSKPDINPEHFSGGISHELWSSVLQDTLKPLFNRLVQAQYPPGSTYKMVSALAAIEENIITPDLTFHCSGSYRLGNRTFMCWKKEGHGKTDLYGAIKGSCNVYFYNLIQRVGLNNWVNYSAFFEFGRPSGIDLPEEASGILPDEKYMDSRYGRNGWGKGNLLNLAIGQGEVLTTPLQLVRYTAAIASQGKLLTPHLVRSIYDRNQDKLIYLSFPEKKIEQVSPKSWQIIIEGMKRVVQSSDGTARSVNIAGLDIHGKTGTAQNPHGEDHAWFIGFSGNPRFPYSFVVLVENGGSGSGKAAPVAKKMLQFYMEKNL
jgi:penicillin-binding protein 2